MFNLQSAKIRRIYQQIIDKKIDILLIQELSAQFRSDIINNKYTNTRGRRCTLPFYDDTFPGYTLYAANTETAILYRNDLPITPIAPKRVSQHKHKSATLFTGVIYHQNNVQISIYSFYRNPQNRSNAVELFQIDDQCDGCIFGGDINLHHYEWGSNKSDGNSDNFVHFLSESELKLINDGSPTHYNKANQTESCIDITLISNNLDYNNWKAFPDFNKEMSDHYLITFEIDVQQQFGFSDDRWSWDLSSRKWAQYVDKMNMMSKYMRDEIRTVREQLAYVPRCKQSASVYIDTINELCENITNNILNIAHSTIGTRKFYRGYKPWWNKEIGRLIRKCKRSRRRVQYYMERGINEFNRTRAAIQWDQRYINRVIELEKDLKNKNREIRKAKRKYKQVINKRIQTNTNNKLFYRTLNQKKYRKQNVIPPLFTDNKQTSVTDDPNVKATLIHNVVSNPPQPHFDDAHRAHHIYVDGIADDVIQSGYESEESDLSSPDLFNDDIQFYEVRNCVAVLENDKAMGPDFIHNVLIIKAGVPFMRLLVDLFNLCLIYHVFPAIWNNANIIPIPKPDKDHRFATNYRPIAISSCVGRIFERVLSKRLQSHCVDTQIFNNNQCGFQLNRCTADMLAIFMQHCYYALDIASDVDCVFTDFSKAYDSVWHKGLIMKMYTNYAIRGHVLYTLISFLCGRFTRIQLINGCSDWRLQEIGLPQGSSLSPILYILYTNDYLIPYYLTKYVDIGLFADDTIFWTIPHVKDSLRYSMLQKVINNFYDWCCYWKLSLNPTKCKQMTITKTLDKTRQKVIMKCDECNTSLKENAFCNQHQIQYGKVAIHRKYTINGKTVERVKVFKYLGLVIDEDLNFNHHTNRVMKKMNQHYYQLSYLIHTKFELQPRTTLMLYKQKSRAYIEYGANFYYHNNKVDEIQVIQNKFIRLAAPTKRSTPIDIIHNIHHMQPVVYRITTLRLRLWLRTIYSSEYHPLFKAYDEYNYRINEINCGRLRPFRPKAKSYYTHQSPLYLAQMEYLKIRNSFDYPLPIQPCRGPITALPNYFVSKYPTNFRVITKECLPENFGCFYHFYTDGSCKPNPGIGAFGWFCLSDPNRAHSATLFPVLTSILAMELLAIIKVMKYIERQYNKCYKTIVIFVDNLPALHLLEGSMYPKYNCYKLMIEEILQSLANLMITKPEINITYAKIKSHQNHEGNNEVDKLVSDLTRDAQYDTSQQAAVTFPTALGKIFRHYNTKQFSDWEQRENKEILCRKLFRNWPVKLYKIFKHLDRYGASIMIQLISEHINLNKYYHKMNYIPCESPVNEENDIDEKKHEINDTDDEVMTDVNNTRILMKELFGSDHDSSELDDDEKINEITISENCVNCELNEKEDVNHFIFKCSAYKTQREQLRTKLISIYSKYVMDTIFNMKHVLFPFCIKKLPLYKQIKITRCLINYVKSTKRLRYKFMRNENEELNEINIPSLEPTDPIIPNLEPIDSNPINNNFNNNHNQPNNAQSRQWNRG